MLSKLPPRSMSPNFLAVPAIHSMSAATLEFEMRLSTAEVATRSLDLLDLAMHLEDYPNLR